jgi:hypothetical protein
VQPVCYPGMGWGAPTPHLYHGLDGGPQGDRHREGHQSRVGLRVSCEVAASPGPISLLFYFQLTSLPLFLSDCFTLSISLLHP